MGKAISLESPTKDCEASPPQKKRASKPSGFGILTTKEELHAVYIADNRKLVARCPGKLSQDFCLELIFCENC